MNNHRTTIINQFRITIINQFRQDPLHSWVLEPTQDNIKDVGNQIKNTLVLPFFVSFIERHTLNLSSLEIMQIVESILGNDNYYESNSFISKTFIDIYISMLGERFEKEAKEEKELKEFLEKQTIEDKREEMMINE